jgi:hypothetical protein
MQTTFAQTAATATPEQIEAARIARLRLLCVQVSGGDLTQLDGQLKFQRCMKDPPRQAMLQNTLGVKTAPAQTPQLVTGPIPQLVTPQGPLVHPAQSSTLQPAATTAHPDGCLQGYVWREASPQDHVCVTPVMRRLTAQDNAAAARRALPNADACRAGFVWREAFAGDHVCVTPAARSQAAADNAQAQVRSVRH